MNELSDSGKFIIPAYESSVFTLNAARNECIHLQFYLNQESSLTFFIGLDGTESLELRIEVFLEGERAQAEIKGTYQIRANQRLTITTLQHHKESHTKSDLKLKGVLHDQSSLEYRGLVIIEKNASFSQASQINKNLVFDQAKARAIPNMEVKTNEVQAEHGCAVGQINKEQLFYLQSRGFEYEKAKELLIQGFLQRS